MKIQFTEAEVAEILQVHVLNTVAGIDYRNIKGVEFDTAYGYFKKVTVTIEMQPVEDDSDA